MKYSRLFILGMFLTAFAWFFFVMATMPGTDTTSFFMSDEAKFTGKTLMGSGVLILLYCLLSGKIERK